MASSTNSGELWLPEIVRNNSLKAHKFVKHLKKKGAAWTFRGAVPW